jgi:xanthine dehydrogenase accessory factor
MSGSSLSWIEALAATIGERGPLVRITIVRADGSTPRECGASMLVSDHHIDGTIGGGALELEAIAHARRLLAAHGEVGHPWHREVRDLALGPSLGQCCGGFTRLLFEVFTAREQPRLTELVATGGGRDALVLRPLESGHPIQVVSDRKAKGDWPLAAARILRDMLSGARPREATLVKAGKGEAAWFVEPTARHLVPLYIYGAGHVGRALVHVLRDLPFAVMWVDTAKARFPEAVPSYVVPEVAADPAAFAAFAPVGAFHIVLTYSHALDLAICRTLLRRGDFGYLGLIGSTTKRARFLKRLREGGIAEGQLQRLTCPIGIPGLAGKDPGVIAIAVAADLAQRASAHATGQSVLAAAEDAPS